MSKLISTAKRYEPDMDLPYANMFEKTDGDYVSYADYAAQAARIEQLTAESVALKNAATSAMNTIMQSIYEYWEDRCHINQAFKEILNVETPATDAALREIQVQGIKYARNRLIASFTHGFLDKPESEVRDICQMLNDAAIELKKEATDDWVSETFGDEFLAAPLGV